MPADKTIDLETLRVVHGAAQSGDFAGAAQLAAQALDRGFEHPFLYNIVALKMEQDGNALEAANLLSRAAELAPKDKPVRNALGWCLLRLDLPVAALVQFTALLALDSTIPFAHTGHGAALLALGAHIDAEASYRRAVELDPNQGVALAGLAHVACRRGRYAEARGWAERALDKVPDFPDALMSLVAADLGEGIPQRAEQRLLALLSSKRVDPLDRAYAYGLLGDVYDSRDRVREAFEAYTTCNNALHTIHADRFGNGQSAFEYVKSITEYFAHSPVEAWRPRPNSIKDKTGPQQHVFLLGFPRSGTTLLEVILEGHPDVVSVEEHELLVDSINEFMRGPEGFDSLSSASEEMLQPLRQSYWRLAADAGVNTRGKIFVDKHPLNTLKLPLIARLFPTAKIVFASRDPRDVVLSCFRNRFRMSAPFYELLSFDGAARYYDAVMRFADLMAGVLALDTCLVRHEDLVNNLSHELERICTFLRINRVPEMEKFSERTQQRAALTPSTAQLARGLDASGIGRWRRYQKQLSPVLEILEPWVKRFGYSSQAISLPAKN